MYLPKLTERRPSVNNIQRGVSGFDFANNNCLSFLLFAFAFLNESRSLFASADVLTVE